MNRKGRPRGHLDTESVLDYLDGRANAAQRRAVEDHLALPCSQCRDLVRELGLLVERMRLDRTPDVPEALQARALAVYQPRERPAAIGRAVTTLARLLFDSWSHPGPAMARRATGEVRRLRFALGRHALELEAEPGSVDSHLLRGRLEVTEPALHRVEIAVGAERLGAWPDTDGWFVFDHVPGGSVRITVAGPSGRYRLPPLKLHRL
jgi:hypothetical protein